MYVNLQKQNASRFMHYSICVKLLQLVIVMIGASSSMPSPLSSSSSSSAVALDFDSMLKEARRGKLQKSKVKSMSAKPSTTSSLPSNKDISFNPNFLSEDESNDLMSYLSSSSTDLAWNECGGRKVIILGGVPHPSGALLEPFPSFCSDLADKLIPHFDGERPNQVLLNFYTKGQGILAHNDGPLYNDTAAIICIGSSAVLNFEPEEKIRELTTMSFDSNDKCEPFSVFLPPRSLLVFKNTSYSCFKHGIAPLNEDVITPRCINAQESNINVGDVISRGEQRYSLTFRRVKHVAKVIDEFGPANEEEASEISRRRSWWLRSITD